MKATGARKSYKGWAMNAKGTAHFFDTGKNTCLCGDMEAGPLDKRSRQIPPGTVKIAQSCEDVRRQRGL
jgi:hypothetical protein